MQDADISRGLGYRSLPHCGLLTPIYVPSEERYLDGLDAEQVAAVSSPSKDLAIIAPAGAGKSTTIAARARTLERKVFLTGEVIAVCFGRDAARSIGRKLSSAGSHARAMTIHSLALRLLRTEREASTGLPAVIRLCSIDGSEGDAILNAELRTSLGRWVKSAKKRWPGEGMTVSRARDAVARIESGGRAEDKSEAHIWRMYKRWMRSHSRDDDIVVDYGYAIIRATQLVDDDRSRPVRVPVRTRTDVWGVERPVAWTDRSSWVPVVSALVVDEAQDVNPRQHKLLKALRPEWLTMVGDPDQAIYTFQGGDPSWLMTGHDRSCLVTDYRSTRAIVRVAAAVSGHDIQPASGAPEGDPVRLYRADDEDDEDAWIAGEVQSLLDAGLPPIPDDDRGIVILTREAERGQRISEYLEAHRLGGSVEVATVHSYKGRQKEAVIVAGISEETWTKSGSDDARRVLYVAVSRARGYLRLSYAGTEQINHKMSAVHPLHLLAGLPVEEVDKISDSSAVAESMDPGLESELAELYKALGGRKAQADRIAGLYRRLGDEGKARRMEGCASLAVFAHAVRTDSDDLESIERWSLESADYCHVRLCNLCNWRTSREQWLRLSAIHWWAMTVNHRRHDEGDQSRYQEPLLLTLTIPNVQADDLGDAIRLLGKAWNRMSVVPSWDREHRTRRWRLWSRVLPGQWRTIEVTRNPETGMYHPHMHVLMLATGAYARAYHRDDPSREGLDWVRLDNGRYGSPYYKTSRDWAEDWTASVLAAQGSRVSGSSMSVEDDPDGGLLVKTPQINGGRLLVDVRRTRAGSKDISEVTKYVSKDLEIIPPSLDDDEAAKRLSVMDSALERVHLITQRGSYKTILDRALSGTLRDWLADDPRTAEPLDMDELVKRYQATLGGGAWSTDRWSYAGWDGSGYKERYRKDPVQDSDSDEDPFDDDDEEW